MTHGRKLWYASTVVATTTHRTWFLEEEEVLVLGVEGVVVEGRRSQRAEVVQLEAADLAHEPLAGAVLLAAHAHEQVREVERRQPVLRVAEMHNLAVALAATVFRLVLLARLRKIGVLRERQLAAEVPRFHGRASAAHVARPACWVWHVRASAFWMRV
jgi:hypothetical protein